ncbi:uncharacterized protein [Henckelia pumila]|uniref:uncharacterized protein n=1 Tax=Henckelia pumila TaxID=405737 RepID=UPI003C6DCE32
MVEEVSRVGTLDSSETAIVGDAELTLRDRIREGQQSDAQLLTWRQRDVERDNGLYIVEDGIVRYRGRLWVPADDTLRQEVMTKAHRSPYSIHPGSTKKYKYLQHLYWWPGEGRAPEASWDVEAAFYLIVEILHHALSTRLNFSIIFHPQTDGQSERVIQTLEDLLRDCVLDFRGSWDVKLPLIEFDNNGYQASIQMSPYKALYGRKCRTPIHWDDVGERVEMGPKIVRQTAEMVVQIRQCMRTAQSRHKSYADRRRHDLEFVVGDHVFFKVAPMKGVLRFGKKVKLSPHYIGPFEILERVGTLAYRLALSPHLSAVHNFFHVSMLRKYMANPTHVLELEPLQLAGDLSFVERPIRILERQERKLRNRVIPMVKVQWQNHSVEESTWELEADMQAIYPDLFGKLNFGDEFLFKEGRIVVPRKSTERPDHMHYMKCDV